MQFFNDVSEFFCFWGRCLKEGFSFSWDTFGVVDLLCGFIAAWFLWHNDHHQKKWEKLEVSVRKYAALIIAAQFLVGMICVAPFLQFHDEHSKAKAIARKNEAENDFAKYAVVTIGNAVSNAVAQTVASILTPAQIAKNAPIATLTDENEVKKIQMVRDISIKGCQKFVNGDFSGAYELLNEAIGKYQNLKDLNSLNNDFVIAVYAGAINAAHQISKNDRACELADEALITNPCSRLAALKALTLIWLNKFAESIPIIQQWYDADPNNPSNLMWRTKPGLKV